MEARRNIVPLMLEGFDFTTPSIASQLTGQLTALKQYNALRVPADYFAEAMDRLREKFLSVPLEAVLHPASTSARQAAEAQQAAAGAAPAVGHEELTAQEWFEKGFNAVDHDEEVRCYTEAIRLKPDFAAAYCNRGVARRAKGDLDDGALKDYAEAIRLKPDFATAYYNRGVARHDKGDLDGALKDYGEAIRLKPDDASAYNNRGFARGAQGDLDGALKDYAEAIRVKPDYAEAYNNRGAARVYKGDLDGALKDYAEAIRLEPDYANAYYNRGLALRAKCDSASTKAAIADFQKYLDLGGGVRGGDQAEVEQFIRDLKNKR